MREPGRGLSGAAVGLLTLVACAEPPLLIAPDDIPEHIDLLALLPASDDGVGAGSGLISARGRAVSPVEAIGRADSFLLLGYRAAQFPGFSDEVLQSTAVRPAGSADPVMPAPDWARRVLVRGDETELVIATNVPSLTADWLRCDFDPERHYVHVRCGACSPQVELRRDGCSVKVNTQACVLGIAEISIPLSGGGRLGQPTVPGQSCALIPDAGESLVAFECTLPQTPHQCRLDIVERRSPSASGFTVTTRELVSAPLAESQFEARLEVYGRGYVSDLALLDDRVIAAVHGPEADSWFCEHPSPTRLAILDADTLETVSTATAPPCLFSIAHAAGAQSFFATFGENPPSIGRFDARGALLEARSLNSVVAFSRPRIVDLELRPDGRLVLIVNETAAGLGDASAPAAWLLIDASSLEVLESQVLRGSHALLRVTPSGESYAVQLDSESVVRVDERGAETVGSVRFVCSTAALRIGDFQPLSRLRHLIVGRLLYPLFFGVDFAAQSCARDSLAEVEADPASVLPWRGDEFLVTARGRDPERRATLLRFDTTRTLLQPGPTQIGRGLTRLRRVDARGRAFGVATESGSVFRVDPN